EEIIDLARVASVPRHADASRIPESSKSVECIVPFRTPYMRKTQCKH
ncbi:hypothetical protein NL511_29445, partial [Klebsiella pneumoniae]|nr:hypothetical protein [Klebsiella pneumoniae]